MRRITAFLLAMVLMLSLVACGGEVAKDAEEKDSVRETGAKTPADSEDAPQIPTTDGDEPQTPAASEDGLYLFRGTDRNGVVTTDALGAVAEPLEPAQVYGELEYVPEMFYGQYALTTDNKLSEEQTEAYLTSYDYMTVEKGTTQMQSGTRFPVLPYHISAGTQSVSNVLTYDTDYDWAELKFLSEEGYMNSCHGRYEIDGNIFRFYPVTKSNYDRENLHLTYQMSDLVWEYEFSFSGPHLTLSQGENSITLTAENYLNTEYFCSASGYLALGSETFDAVDEVGLYGGDSAFVRAEEYGLYHSAVVGLNEEGLFTLSWKDKEDNSYTRQFVYFLCGLDGLVLADREGTYLFTAQYADRHPSSLNHSISYEEQEKLQNMPKEEVEQIIEKREDLLSDLAAAYEAAGLAVTVDRETGEIIMDSSVLFAVNSAEISPEGRAFLQQFIQIYTGVVFSDKYEGFVSRIMVEGHTDTNGDYDYNLELSQKRADSVRDYCLTEECGVESSSRTALAEMLTSVGYSYTNPVYKADGQVDMDASRRVAFRFLINLTGK